MGRDKAIVEIDGIPLIRRIYNAVAGCRDLAGTSLAAGVTASKDRIYIVTPWAQTYEPLLPPTCQFIAERSPDRGPLMAFSQASSEIDSTWVLLLACDLPNLSTAVIQSWIDGLPSVPAQNIAYLPKHHKGWEPLCGFYRQTGDRSLHEYIQAGGRSLQGWLQLNPVAELLVTDPFYLANCNTPAELDAIVSARSKLIADADAIDLK
jgi:molybdenum cofactor guanylyltransferase